MEARKQEDVSRTLEQLQRIETGSEALPSFAFWKETANSAAVKSPEILNGDNTGALQRSYILLLIRVELTHS